MENTERNKAPLSFRYPLKMKLSWTFIRERVLAGGFFFTFFEKIFSVTLLFF